MPDLSETFLIHWEERLIAGSLAVNPTLKDRKTTLCYGETPVTAASAHDAARQFTDLFPAARVVNVT